MTQEFLRKKFKEFLQKYGAYELYVKEIGCPFELKMVYPDSIIIYVEVTIENVLFWGKLSDLWKEKYFALESSKEYQQKEEEETETHMKLILEHLKEGKSITPLDALKMFGCLRLSGRIFDLRKAGYNINTEIVYNGKKKYAEYTLITQ